MSAEEARLLDCGLCYEENGEEVHPHPECTAGMSRSRLHGRLVLMGLPADVADRAIEAFAHELTEELRSFGATAGYWTASLIGPEVS